MKKATYLLFLLTLTAISCQRPGSTTTPRGFATADELQARAERLAHQNIIVDGHVDLPYRLRIKHFRLERQYLDMPIKSDGNFDYEKAKRGGLSAPFMSVYIPAEYQITGGARVLADSLIDMVRGIAAAHPDKFALANSPAQVQTNFKNDLISLPMGMENGAPIENEVKNVRYFFDRGIRYVTLTHGKDNQICDSSYDSTRTHGGLSAFGREVVVEMNRLGMLVDISHVSDDTFFQVIDLSKVPVIASHSSCRAFTPGFKRNMSDEMIKALGKNGGIIMINFATSFLDETMRLGNADKGKQLIALLKEKGLKETDEAAKPIITQFQRENPTVFAPIELVADHIDHAVKLAGIDHVGFGSDFDGVGDTLPTDLKDVSQYPNLIRVLLKRGYSETDIAKLCSGNFFRVWNQVLSAAKNP
ncbi:MAG: dipeptidase [Cytophagaceae bacterium]|nr:dipeptidase [Cytophagaceae bacterium]